MNADVLLFGDMFLCFIGNTFLNKEILQPQPIAEMYPESINPTQAKTKKKRKYSAEPPFTRQNPRRSRLVQQDISGFFTIL
jgi:hypothetical protein